MRTRFHSKRRARYEWLGATGAVVPTTIAINTNTTFILLPQATLEEWPRGSLARIIGSLFVSPATAPAAATGYGVFMGMYWSPGSTFDPELNPEWQWKWWHCLFPQIGGTAVADSNASRWAGYFPIQFDMKQHHRWNDNEQLLLNVKNSSVSGASIQVSFAFRFLVRAGL